METIFYRDTYLYNILMLLLYGKNYRKRLSIVAGMIPNNSSVLEICCGPCELYQKYLKCKNIEYLGLDISPEFVNAAVKKGINARKFDMFLDPLPSQRYKYIVMQASLYQFIPNHIAIIEKMLNATKRFVIISEPIKNLSNSNIKILSVLAKKMTRPAEARGRYKEKRFNEESLDLCFQNFKDKIKHKIKVGRDKIFILGK